MATEQAPALRIQRIGDAWTLSYAGWIAFFLLFAGSMQELDFVFGFGLPIAVLFMLSFAALALFLLWAAISSLWNWRWRRLLSLIIAPIPAFMIYLVLADMGVDATWLRFQLHKSGYLEDIAKLRPQDTSPLIMIWPWDAEQSGEASIIYDESDEVALPKEQRSLAWKKRIWALAETGVFIPGFSSTIGLFDLDVDKVDGHFYLVEEAVD